MEEGRRRTRSDREEERKINNDERKPRVRWSKKDEGKMFSGLLLFFCFGVG